MMGECVFAEFAGMQAARRPSSQRRQRALNSQSSSENALSCQKGLKWTLTLASLTSSLLITICVPHDCLWMAASVVPFPLLSHTKFVLACFCIVSDCGQSLCLFFIMADIRIWPPSGDLPLLLLPLPL